MVMEDGMRMRTIGSLFAALISAGFAGKRMESRVRQFRYVPWCPFAPLEPDPCGWL